MWQKLSSATYSAIYSITCICSMWQKLSSLTHSAIVLHVSVLCNKNCPRYSQCYSITCICSMWQKLSSLLAVLLYYMYLFYVTKIVLATSSVIVLHVSVLCDKNCPRYSQCYIVLHVSVLCDKNCPHYSQCYSITCICSMWQKLSSLLAVL